MAREKARRPTSVVVRDSLVAPAVLVPPQPPSAFPQPTLDAYTVASPLPPTPPFVSRRPFSPPPPAVPLCHPPLHDPPGCDYLLPLVPARPFPHPSYLPYAASAAIRRRTRTLGAPLLLAADAKAAQRYIWRDAKEVVGTEPSKLLSNEPQASCRNLRSGKFPRRPCCSSIYLGPLSLSPSPPLSLSFFTPSTQEASPKAMQTSHTQR